MTFHPLLLPNEFLMNIAQKQIQQDNSNVHHIKTIFDETKNKTNIVYTL